MINRILIRIKVVQMLYSYFLTRSEFRIEMPPEKKSRDSQYAYMVYIETLLLILKLTGRLIAPSDSLAAPVISGKNVLSQSKVAEALASNNDLREIMVKRSIGLTDYKDILQYILDKISESGVYADFSKKRQHDLDEEVKMWCIIIENLLAKDETFREASRNNDMFTIAGLERGLAMAAETLRSYNDVKSMLAGAKRSLKDSLDKAYLLYYALLTLPVEITRLRAEQIENAKEKYLPTDDDLNPNLRFIDNILVKKIEQSAEIEEYFKANPFTWSADYYLVKKLLDDILQSGIYADYMAQKNTSEEADCEFWRMVMRDIILPSDALAEALESKSVYWNDDITIVGTFVLKTMRKASMSKNHSVEVYPMYKDDEDAEFGQRLFSDSVDHMKEYRALIDKFINETSWDTERLALMDIVIITVAISEIVNFPLIPVQVTLNEYIEIANYYSAPHSGPFINGVLSSVIKELNSKGVIHKSF